MATSAEIRNKAAKKLGLFGTGQTLRSAISADLDDAVTEVFAELENLGLKTWGATAEVPDHLVWPVVAKVAYSRVTEYPTPVERYNRVAADFSVAEGRIQALVAQRKVGQVKIEAF